ncbi:DUF4112 domain-containing protein [Sphingobacterium psychroaquaticum]|uniref:Uncharacterized protein n=1 Tax=Sphingobacterium psychroaquaticum TaxID=561061 RepID=A0A1X7L137_9SPHI|nr:DUF4112 domain-containing protein [Sphingobacterium psychroaquaticum]QBQ39794.1 DUF4112 domain-containing protein [Sphingobacterium psychroaquaticum]SMG47410.1 protein of unknown function [Sphingobacterium psychroaquaticum]
MRRERTSTPTKVSEDFYWVRKVTVLLDSKFRIGQFRFGIDPILNFIPIAGQIITFTISVLLVLIMFRNGVSSKAATKMLLNTMTDATVGAIPFIGNIYDFYSKANQKNIRILEEYYYENKHQGSAKGILFSIFAILLLLCTLIIILLWSLGKWLIALF